MEQSHRHVQHLLYRFLRCSRAETPEGSQLTFVGDEIIPLCFVTKQPSLSPSSYTRHPISVPYGALTLPGGRRAYHVASVYLHGVGRASPPGMQHLRPVTLDYRFLIPDLLVQACQHLPLVSHHDVYQPFTSVDRPMPSSLPTPLMLGVVTSAHAFVTILQDEATLSQQLHTPPLPVTHVLGGYWWQNTRLCPVYTVDIIGFNQSSVSSANRMWVAGDDN